MGHKRNIHVPLKVDNSTALFYINNIGSIRSPCLDSLSRFPVQVVIGVVHWMRHFCQCSAHSGETELQSRCLIPGLFLEFGMVVGY